MLTKRELLSKSMLRTVDVKLPAGVVTVREMNGAEREECLKRLTGATLVVDPGIQAQIACWCIVDENKDPVFEPGDVEAINTTMSGTALESIVLAALEISGLTGDAADDLAGNSEGGLSDVSGSSSPKLSAAQ